MALATNLVVFETPEQLAIAAAERFVEQVHRSIADDGRFSVALAGGNTPRRVYELLATEFKARIDWANVHLFFGDERCVPADHPESNYRMVYTTLISRVAVPAGNVRRIIGEGDPKESAHLYENQLKFFFAGLAWPRFDLMLLGMGKDAHTASLFPHSEALGEKSTWVSPTRNVELDQDRITLTAPVFNHAAYLMFLVTGKDKAERLADVLEGASDPDRLPAQMITPTEGALEWLVDRAAASCLTRRP
jgi:6-phosphogluconolactonase